MTPDLLMKFADFRLTRWKTRADTEWKISLAFWGLLVVAIDKVPPKLLAGSSWYLPVISSILYVLLWVVPIWARNSEDQREAFRLAGEAGYVRPIRRWWQFWFWFAWAAVFQALTTILLVFYAWWAISTGSSTGPH